MIFAKVSLANISHIITSHTQNKVFVSMECNQTNGNSPKRHHVDARLESMHRSWPASANDRLEGLSSHLL